MIAALDQKKFSLRARDVSGQNTVRVNDLAADATVGELTQGLVSKMRLPATDSEGRQLTYHALLEREGRHLHSSETIGDVIEDDDQIVLQPNIQAGGF